MKENETYDLLTMRVAESLQKLLESGFELPLHAAMVSVNGCALFIRYSKKEASLGAEILASRDLPEGYLLPINIMFIDAEGKAARLLIHKTNEYQLFNLAGTA